MPIYHGKKLPTVTHLQFVCVKTWRHQMETFFALLAICPGNHRSPVNSPHKGQWRLNKQLYGWWFDTPSRPLWCHCNEKKSMTHICRRLRKDASIRGQGGLIKTSISCGWWGMVFSRAVYSWLFYRLGPKEKKNISFIVQVLVWANVGFYRKCKSSYDNYWTGYLKIYCLKFGIANMNCFVVLVYAIVIIALNVPKDFMQSCCNF